MNIIFCTWETIGILHINLQDLFFVFLFLHGYYVFLSLLYILFNASLYGGVSLSTSSHSVYQFYLLVYILLNYCIFHETPIYFKPEVRIIEYFPQVIPSVDLFLLILPYPYLEFLFESIIVLVPFYSSFFYRVIFVALLNFLFFVFLLLLFPL